MNHLHIHRWMAIFPISIGAITLIIILAIQHQTCEVPAADITRSSAISADAMPRGGKTDEGPTHCLVYGKYCVGEYLRGR